MIKIEPHIEEILKGTFSRLYSCYPQIGKECLDNSNNTRLIFPPYGEDQNGEARVSEQELRFTFVETFSQYFKKKDKNNCYKYSVETPTVGKYLFSYGKKVKELEEKGEKIEIPCIHEEGISGNIDMVIHGEDRERLCLIEFKANNPETEDIEKDLVKLTNCEENNGTVIKHIPRYFICIVRSTKPQITKESIEKKFNEIRNKTKDERNCENVYIKYFNLAEGEILYKECFRFKK